MPWKNNTWVDDDGSLTVGTPFDAEHMNNIELGIAEDAAGVAAASGMAGSALVQAASGVTAAGSALVTAQQANARAASGVTAAGSALVTGQFAGALAASGVTAAGSALVTGQQANARAASGVAAAGSGVTGVTNLLNKLAAAGLGVVLHGSEPNVQRPFGFDSVAWIGTVEPVNAAALDPWINPEDFGIGSERFVPAAKVYKATGQSIAKGTYGELVFDSERYDNAGIHSTVTATNKLVAPKAGLYLIELAFGIASGSGKVVDSVIRKNAVNTSTQRQTVSPAGNALIAHCTVIQMAAGDYVDALALNNNETEAKTTEVSGLMQAPQEMGMTWLGSGLTSPEPVNWGVVTELPAAAGVGDTCQLKVRETAESPWKIWECVKLEASGERPWAKIGGPPLRAEYTGAETLSTESETAQTTNAPSITLPALKMDANFSWGALRMGAGAASSFAEIDLYINGATPVVGTGARYFASAGPAIHVPARATLRTTAEASQVVQGRYRRQLGSGAAIFYTPYVEVDPVRLG